MQQLTQTTRVYHSAKEMERGNAAMLRDGWQYVGAVQNQPRSSVLRIILIGWIFKPKPEIIVTYQRGSVFAPVQPQPSTRRPTLKEEIEAAKQRRKERFGF